MSLIWLTSPKLNFHLEALVANEGSVGDSGESVRATQFIVNPAVRYAVDVGTLQIVPGFGVPIIFQEDADTEHSFFFYLSLEHPVSFL